MPACPCPVFARALRSVFGHAPLSETRNAELGTNFYLKIKCFGDAPTAGTRTERTASSFEAGELGPVEHMT
jgi:hypothetical protein